MSLLKRFFISIILLFVLLNSYSQPKVPGQMYTSSNGYVEYIFGNLPVIITAPHGGSLTPATIPNRTAGSCGGSVTTVNDANTALLARAIDTAFFALMGCHPHVVMGLLSRTKIDLNREIVEAACGNSIAQQTWTDWHNFIYEAKTTVMTKYGRGLNVDVHGHGHTIQRHELGYNISGTTLRGTDADLNLPANVNISTIRYLVGNNTNNNTHAQLIRGTNAFGTLLVNRGYPSVPSQQDPAPASGDSYFSGGYNVERWGSKDTGTIDAIQIECNMTGVRDNATNRRKFADSLVRAIKVFMEMNMMASIACDAVVLPVKISSFRAQLQNESVLVSWVAEEEQNILTYRLHRSYDGINFSIIKEQPSTALNISPKKYDYTDGDLNGREKIYYRLESADNDGSSSYSSVIHVKLGKLQIKALSIVNIYPNPASDKMQLTLNVRKKGDYVLQLVNSFGQTLINKPLNLDNGFQNIELPRNQLPSGLYIIQISTSFTGEKEIRRIFLN